jgi:hypothetical protein
MFKKIAALLFLLPALAFGQSKVYNASTYGSWGATTTSVNATGSSSIGVAPSAVYATNSQLFVPFQTNESLTIDSETFTVTSATNCFAGSSTCTVNATFSDVHAAGAPVSSGTFGLQEAINQALLSPASGTVLIDNTWQGPAGNALILAAHGSINVVIQDNRSGVPVYYQSGGGGYVPAAAAPSITVHTLTGATPTAAVTSATNPTTDVNNLLLSVNVTSFTLPASTAVADGEILRVNIQQGTSAAYTLPAATASSPFTAGAGTTLINAVPGGCPTIGTVTGSTPSQLFAVIVYHAATTQYQILGCQAASPNTGVVDAPINASGTFGAAAVGTVIANASPNQSGHFTSLQITTTLSGTCTTAPTFSIFDGTTNVGTPQLASATTQTKGNATSVAQTLTFVAGDNIGIYVSTAGATCTTSTFAVSAQYLE